MSQSTLTISATPYNLDVFDYQETETANVNEIETVIDPDDYDDENSILTAGGHKRHEFKIKGKCTLAQRTTFITALRNHTKVYPVIYPGNGTTNVITSSAYYYLKSISGSFHLANENYYYTMDFKYGGV